MWRGLRCSAISLFVLALLASPCLSEKRACTDAETRYTLTECDQGHGRWRIRLPTSDTCQLRSPEQPVRIQNCDTFCPPGQFYDVNGDLRCHDCLPGYYSLGASEQFTSWNKLPTAFNLDVAVASGDSNYYDTLNKTEAERQCPDSAASFTQTSLGLHPSNCVVILSYAATLVRDGFFSVAYRHTDSRNNFLSLQIENSACQRAKDKERSFRLEPTKSSEWKVLNVSLATGTSVISLWLERAPMNSESPVAVYIKNVTVSGVAYTSECRPCMNGTFAANGRSAICDLCPADTYANAEASHSCTTCGPLEYAEPGSDRCTPRKPCTASDYYATTTPCDVYGNTMLTYTWLPPKRCNEKLPGAVDLPASVQQKCASCNPGQFYNRTKTSDGKEIQSCSFCPAGTYSNGIEPCKACPSGSFSISGIFWRLWQQQFPKDIVTNTCDGDDACSSSLGWHARDDYLQTVQQHTPVAYSVLSFRVDRVRRPVKLSINFEADCQDNCIFIIATTPSGDLSDADDYDMVFKSTGKMPRQLKMFEITSTPPYTLHVMFRKLTASKYRDFQIQALMSGSARTPSGPFDYNVARIYDFNLTNVEPGGIAECYDCKTLNPQPQFCKTCQAGMYRVNDTICVECPSDHITPPVMAEGSTSFAGEHSDRCQSCPSHMRASKNGLSCYSDCKFNYTHGSSVFHYDLSPLGLGIAPSLPMFLPSGTKYQSVFNITLCGDGTPPVCQRGKAPSIEISSLSSSDKVSSELSYGKSRVCSATVLQPSGRVWASKIVGTRLVSISFGDVSDAVRASNASLPDTFPSIFNSSNLPNSGSTQIPDIVFVFKADEKSDQCPKGPVTVVVARCDPRAAATSAISLPHICPSGSCDNCHYLLLWTSSDACPRCNDKETDYEIVNGECSFGSQVVYRYPKPHCLLLGKEREVVRTQVCTALPLAAQIGIVLVIALVIVLTIVLLYTCKRTKKLEYRYMKLVESTGVDACELPQAESCAVEVDAPDDFEPAVAGAGDVNMNKMERMRIGGTKVKKFRTIESDDDRHRGGRGGGSNINNAFFEASDSPQMESLMTARSSVL